MVLALVQIRGALDKIIVDATSASMCVVELATLADRVIRLWSVVLAAAQATGKGKWMVYRALG